MDKNLNGYPNFFLTNNNRRNSSYFRPSRCNNYPLIHEYSDFEKLPVSILLRIFTFLKKEDLLNVCLSCKLLYLPSAIQLYQNIIVSTKNLKEYERINNLVNFNLTLIDVAKLPLLANTLMNNFKISKNVKSLQIIDLDFDWLSMAKLGNATMTYFELIKRLFRKIKLVEFYCPSLSISHFKCLYSADCGQNVLQKLHISMKSNDQSLLTYGLSSKNKSFQLINLTHLKISYNLNDSELSFRKLVDYLYTSRSLSNLKTLEFENLEIEIRNGNSLRSTWLYFFQWLSNHINDEDEKLKIESLGLKGHIIDSAKTVELLDRTLKLEKIKNLQLDIIESSHKDLPHDDEHFDKNLSNSNVFLIHLLLKCKLFKLNSVSISPTRNCLKCQIKSIKLMLEKLVNQLINLSLIFDSMTIKDTLLINETIFKFQSNLINLKWNDRSQLIFFKKDLEFWLNSISNDDYEDSLFYGELIKRKIYPFLNNLSSISSSEVIVNDKMISFIKENELKLQHFFRLYLVENMNYQYMKNLKKLQYLCFFGFSFYINYEFGIVQYIKNNGEFTYCFDII